MSAARASLLLASALGLGLALAVPGQAPTAPIATPAPGATGATTVLPETAWQLALPLPEAATTALASRKHGDAVAALAPLGTAQLPGASLGDHAFLLAWSLVRADRAKEAVHLVDAIRSSKNAPEPYLHLTVGELLLADGRHVEAAAELARVDRQAVIWPRARLAEAHALHEAGRTADSLALYEELALRPDPAEGSEVALWALAKRRGLSSPEARELLVRLYRHYPRTEQGRLAINELGERASAADKAWRADSLMEDWAFQAANDLLTPVLGSYAKADEAACVAWYAHGRSHFKRNNVTLAAEVLEPAGQKCVGIDDDRGAKSLYVAGKSLERKKEWAAAARAFQQIPELYPGHSMADDGYALAGIAWQQAGQPDKAVELWTRQVREYPTGDLAAEGFWRLAWTAYLEGDPERAIAWAEESIWQVPLTTDPVHVQAAWYWSGRWRLHPDVADPSALSSDKGQVQRGLEILEQLCREQPQGFYSLLAAARLYELDPGRLAAVARPEPTTDRGGWTVRTEWLGMPSTGWGLALSRLGLVKEALAELSQVDAEQLLPSEYAIQAAVVEHSDPFGAHDKLHHYLLQHPPSTLGADRDRMLHQAFPDLYWDEVQAAAADYDYDARIFHALVREESGFNKGARSHAGAMGLSQLMPATGKHVATKLGLRVSNEQLYEPVLNLRIGTNYYNSLVQRFDGNLFLSTAAYNAGEGNVEKWLAANPGRPTDEFVEAIPFRETRHYVKRVMGTWQLYRSTYDAGPLFPDLSAYNHLARAD